MAIRSNATGRFIPSSFDPYAPNFSAVTLPRDWKWMSLEKALVELNAHSVISLVPFFWQTEPLMSEACRNAGAILYAADDENIPVNIAAVRSLHADTIIGAPETVATHQRAMREKQISVRNIIYIHDAHASSWSARETYNYAARHEVHLFPGLPILTQCTHLSEEPAPHYHPSPEFTWKLSGKDVLLMSAHNTLPNLDTTLPFALHTSGNCACGLPIFERL